jgi:hypothetical protein
VAAPGEYRLRISAGSVSRIATLLPNATARAIWNALPLEARANRWGDEVYFEVPVDLAEEPDARADVAVGDIAYWPPGSAVCLFWGPTPVSVGEEPKAASPVNVFGHIAEDAAAFEAIKSGTKIRLERA